jgi:hypothetical protein
VFSYGPVAVVRPIDLPCQASGSADIETSDHETVNTVNITVCPKDITLLTK